MKFFDRPFIVPTLFLSAALVIGLWMVGNGISSRDSGNLITSTGSAKIEVKADDGRWTVSVYQSAYEGQTATAYNQVSQNAATLAAYFKKANLASSTIVSNIAVADRQYDSNNGPVSYSVHQEVTVSSSDVDGIQKLAQNASALTGLGFSVTPQQPQYYVSNLPDLRVQLQGKAVLDAKARAKQLAESGGSSIGALVSASSGTVQVLAANSSSSDDYGGYDTSTIAKEVSVTARVTFAVK